MWSGLLSARRASLQDFALCSDASTLYNGCARAPNHALIHESPISLVVICVAEIKALRLSLVGGGFFGGAHTLISSTSGWEDGLLSSSGASTKPATA